GESQHRLRVAVAPLLARREEGLDENLGGRVRAARAEPQTGVIQPVRRKLPLPSDEPGHLLPVLSPTGDLVGRLDQGAVNRLVVGRFGGRVERHRRGLRGAQHGAEPGEARPLEIAAPLAMAEMPDYAAYFGHPNIAADGLLDLCLGDMALADDLHALSLRKELTPVVMDCLTVPHPVSRRKDTRRRATSGLVAHRV